MQGFTRESDPRYMTSDTNQERWSKLLEFPGYSVSDMGLVLNDRSGCLMRITRNSRGIRIVGLMRNGIQYKRSIAVLVAQTFLPPPTNEAFDTPIHLDGNRDNSRYDNLMWRPLWFSRRYMRQFTDQHETLEEPIEDVETGEKYESSMAAAMTHGLLDSEIILSMHNNGYVWPTGQVFRRAV